MPKVTRRPSFAAGRAAWTAARKPAASAMTWSEGSTSSTGSPPAARACRAAAAIAGAVLRPTGSSSRAAGVTSSWRSCSATMKRCSSLATTIGAARPGRPSSRCQVACSRLRSPTRGWNCLGCVSRDSGHSRVPEPPERMTGVIVSMGRILAPGPARPSAGKRRHRAQSQPSRHTCAMNLPTRETLRLAWAREQLQDPEAALERASADASFRSYWRARSRGRSWIVMDAPPDREDIRPWLDIAGRLARAGLHVPDIQAADAERGFVLMEDLGDRTLLPELMQTTADRLYGQAMDALLRMQLNADASGLPDYDEQRLVDEMELMPEWFLKRHLGFAPECEQWDVIESAFRALVDNARRQPQVFVHRDYHSRNLLVTEVASPGVIDFQDAVRGPVTYDLVSLLRDCYIAWPDDRVYGWAEEYRQRLGEAGMAVPGPEAFRRAFDLMGLQRHIKVLGIFCRLWYRDGKAGYLLDLPRVWKYTHDVGLRYPETAPLVELLTAAIAT